MLHTFSTLQTSIVLAVCLAALILLLGWYVSTVTPDVDRLAVHGNLHGQPVGFMGKSLAFATAPLLIIASTAILSLAMSSRTPTQSAVKYWCFQAVAWFIFTALALILFSLSLGFDVLVVTTALIVAGIGLGIVGCGLTTGDAHNRRTGALFCVLGATICVLAWVLPPAWCVGILVVGVLTIAASARKVA